MELTDRGRRMTSNYVEARSAQAVLRRLCMRYPKAISLPECVEMNRLIDKMAKWFDVEFCKEEGLPGQDAKTTEPAKGDDHA